MVHKAWPKWLKQEMSPGGYQPSFTDFKINIQEWNPLQMSHYERHHKFLLHPLLLLSILAFREKKRVNSAYGFSIGGQSFCFWLVNESAEAWSTYWTQIQLVSQIVLWYHLITWTTWNFLGCFYQQQRNTGKQNPCKQWILPPLRGQKTKCNGLRVWPTLNSQQFRFSCPLQITLFRWSKNISYTPTWKFLLAGDYSLNFLKKKKHWDLTNFPFKSQAQHHSQHHSSAWQCITLPLLKRLSLSVHVLVCIFVSFFSHGLMMLSLRMSHRGHSQNSLSLWFLCEERAKVCLSRWTRGDLSILQNAFSKLCSKDFK